MVGQRDLIWITINSIFQAPRNVVGFYGTIFARPAMTKTAWIGLSGKERTLLIEVLSSIRGSGRVPTAKIDALAFKIAHAQPYPDITIGVRAGQVQWTAGNPFPIRICDYDGEWGNLPDVDERGRPCAIWLEPADAANRLR